ncbi:hypothetical protein Hanom_Chr01g00043951 [Helianthus anomalus]
MSVAALPPRAIPTLLLLLRSCTTALTNYLNWRLWINSRIHTSRVLLLPRLVPPK